MSAVASSPRDANLRPMREADLDAVMRIEERAYPFPWTRGIMRDCLQAGYAMWVQEARDDGIVGYGVLSIAVGEAHVLNLCTAPGHEGRGLGQRMLQALAELSHRAGVPAVAMTFEPHPLNLIAPERAPARGRGPQLGRARGGAPRRAGAERRRSPGATHGAPRGTRARSTATISASRVAA